MDSLRIAGDLLHLWSIFLILIKIRGKKSCAGISLKTQELYAILFTFRYLDLPWNSNPAEASLSIFFLLSSYYLVYLVRFKYKLTYDKLHDTFRIIFLLLPALLLSLLYNHGFTFLQISWSFSHYLEAVAILPQIFLLQRTGEVDNFTSFYLLALGGYRFLYLLHYICLFWFEGKVDYILWSTSALHTLLYCDFFYYFILSKWYNTKLILPA
eukprot:TRINITY_DN2841_c0_g1_i2.p1 TRINITY_DN2841_c0_g1~~TRINITY_DN2841_c0_g1_i2.p1  ORF type:complete len:212 (-),score=27.62 TRINITY_DN2841_c0_g1_i2:114-749(-)